MKSLQLDTHYLQFLNGLKEKIRSAQIRAALAVNQELIQLYWETGKVILGHSDISTTERYAHLSRESVVSKNELVAIDGGKNKVIYLKNYLQQKSHLRLVPKICPKNEKAPSEISLSA